MDYGPGEAAPTTPEQPIQEPRERTPASIPEPKKLKFDDAADSPAPDPGASSSTAIPGTQEAPSPEHRLPVEEPPTQEIQGDPINITENS